MKTPLLTLILTSAIGGLGCGGEEAGPGAYQADFKTNGAFFTNMSARVMGTSPHGAQQTWYSNDLKDLVGQSTFTAKAGAVAIKEFDVTNDGTVDGFAVMVKKEAGYDAANNDWYYEMRGADGAVMADPPAGKTPMCIGCHKAASGTDFLAATKVR